VPQIGSEEQPLVLKNKKKNNQIGLSGKLYSKENKQKYDSGWDRIFNKDK